MLVIGHDPKNPATQIFLNDIMADELSALLEFIYLGETVIQEERLSEFRAATKVLHIVGVEEQKADQLPIFIDNQNQSPKLENNTESIDKSVHVKKEFELTIAQMQKFCSSAYAQRLISDPRFDQPGVFGGC